MGPFEEDAEIVVAGKRCFNNILKAIEEKDTKKTATRFYDLVKRTYAYARSEGLLEKDKEEIDGNLKGVRALVFIMILSHGWEKEQIVEFNEEVDKLWVVD